MDLILNTLNRITNCPIELSSLVKITICEEATINCYSRKCLSCKTNTPSTFFSEQLSMNEINEDDDVTWITWERSEKRTELQRHITSIATLLEKLNSLWDKFLIHHLITIEQCDYIKKIKLESLGKGTAVIQLDFAENFTIFSQSACSVIILESETSYNFYSAH